uniref:Uncharacterized protein n=1 Tax=Aegilops tauschii subsp. strangulata TaxID=200361 RepID=A0A452Z7Z7_AEGTS
MAVLRSILSCGHWINRLLTEVSSFETFETHVQTCQSLQKSDTPNNLVMYEVRVLRSMEQLRVQKRQLTINNFQVRIAQQVVLIWAAKKTSNWKQLTSARGSQRTKPAP